MLSTKNRDRIILGTGSDAIASDPLQNMFYICTQRWIEQFSEIWQSGDSHKSLIVDDQDQTAASPQVFLKLLFLHGPYGLCAYVYKGEIALLKQLDMIKIVESTFIHTSEAVYLQIYLRVCQWFRCVNSYVSRKSTFFLDMALLWWYACDANQS